MKEANKWWISSAATKLVAAVLIVVVSMTATQNSFAAEQVSDAELALQTGSSKYANALCNPNQNIPCTYDANCHDCIGEDCGIAGNSNTAGDDHNSEYRDSIGAAYQTCVYSADDHSGCERTGTIYLLNRSLFANGGKRTPTCPQPAHYVGKICQNIGCRNFRIP